MRTQTVVLDEDWYLDRDYISLASHGSKLDKARSVECVAIGHHSLSNQSSWAIPTYLGNLNRWSLLMETMSAPISNSELLLEGLELDYVMQRTHLPSCDLCGGLLECHDLIKMPHCSSKRYTELLAYVRVCARRIQSITCIAKTSSLVQGLQRRSDEVSYIYEIDLEISTYNVSKKDRAKDTFAKQNLLACY